MDEPGTYQTNGPHAGRPPVEVLVLMGLLVLAAIVVAAAGVYVDSTVDNVTWSFQITGLTGIPVIEWSLRVVALTLGLAAAGALWVWPRRGFVLAWLPVALLVFKGMNMVFQAAVHLTFMELPALLNVLAVLGALLGVTCAAFAVVLVVMLLRPAVLAWCFPASTGHPQVVAS